VHEPRHRRAFDGISEAKSDPQELRAVRRQVGCKRPDNDANGHRPDDAAPRYQQHANRDARRGPEHGHTRFVQHGEADTRCCIIRDAHRQGDRHEYGNLPPRF
jgi:hypothetical protein